MKLKALILAALLLGLAGIAQAQETYSITLAGETTNRGLPIGQLEVGRWLENAKVCVRGGLPFDCNQAQACAALGVPGGASCTAADALAFEPPARIYPNSLAGRQAFALNHLFRYRLPVYLVEVKVFEAAAAKAACKSLSVADKNVRCAQAGLMNGCDPCGNGE